MKLTKRTISRVGVAVLLVAVVAPFVIFTVPQIVGAEHSYVVLSGSMTPAITVNDAVIVNEASPQSIREGDVIAFHEGGQEVKGRETDVVVHRVVEVTKKDGSVAFKTKGDANDEPDPWTITPSSYVGRVMFTIPYIGYVVGFASTQIGFITLFAVPVGLLVLGEIYDLAVAARNTRHKANRTTETEPEADADGSVAESGVAPRINTDGLVTENAPPAGFDPGVSVAGNGTPVDTHDPRVEPTDPTTDSESGGMDDA